MKIRLFSLVGGAILLVSCQKEISQTLTDENVAGTGTEPVLSRITNVAWRFTSVTIMYSSGETDQSVLDICKSDDVYRYEKDGDVTVTHGTFPCSVDPADGKFASWELSRNGSELKEVYTRDMMGENSGNIVVYKVEFISDHKLITSRTISEDGKTFTELNTYTR